MQVLDGKIAELKKSEGNFPSIEKIIFSQFDKIESWFKSQSEKISPPINSSVDLRYSGYKLATVDTNLFPAGFNNISFQSLTLCERAAHIVFDKLLPKEKRILLLPEEHTRNTFYFRSLKVLFDILSEAGYDVRIGSTDSTVTQPKIIELDYSHTLTLEPLRREDQLVKVKDFVPDLIVLNNDLSSGIPDILLNLKQQILPDLKLGWSSRLKSDHFSFYESLANELARLLDIDPWFLNPYFSSVDKIDFMSQTGLEELIKQTEIILNGIEKKYTEYEIKDKPFVVIKADNGTYGMGVMTISNIDELKQLNRKQRTKMATIKGGQKVDRVMIQEGIYTVEYKSTASVAEPVIYMMGANVVGGFYRLHQKRGTTDNLNAPGMYFEPMDFIQKDHFIDENFINKTALFNPAETQRFYAYSVAARIAAMAAGKEIQRIKS